MYRNGEGVPQNNAEVAIWYRKAPEQGIVAVFLFNIPIAMTRNRVFLFVLYESAGGKIFFRIMENLHCGPGIKRLS